MADTCSEVNGCDNCPHAERCERLFAKFISKNTVDPTNEPPASKYGFLHDTYAVTGRKAPKYSTV